LDIFEKDCNVGFIFSATLENSMQPVFFAILHPNIFYLNTFLCKHDVALPLTLNIGLYISDMINTGNQLKMVVKII
jgi:hypothetical protein